MTENKFEFPQPFPKQNVAFIDVLGFSELVFKSQHAQLEQYFRTITDILSEMKSENSKIQSINISDSIILIIPEGLNGFQRLVKAVRKIQRKLLFRNILIRGAISFGEVYFDDARNIIVGKGYIRAYLLEQEAVYPRVIIDPALMTEMGKDRVGLLEMMNGNLNFDPHSNYIFNHNNFTSIENDAIFVDYAYSLREDGRISEINGKVYNNIKKNLYSEQKLYSKYNWLRNYYLGCIDQSLQLTADKSKLNVLKAWKIKFDNL